LLGAPVLLAARHERQLFRADFLAHDLRQDAFNLFHICASFH